jgi:hypothetical protein
MNKKDCFAEVIESQLSHFTAQCWQWNRYPTFGGLVCVSDASKTVFGIVTHIQTGSIDPTRTPFAYQKTEAELMAEQPQIFEFLKTAFTVHIVGHLCTTSPNTIRYQLAPTPCSIHAFVGQCPTEQAQAFFSRTDYVQLLFANAHTILNLDELLLATITYRASLGPLTHEELDDFCQAFTILTGNDYRRLKLLLQRIEAVV